MIDRFNNFVRKYSMKNNTRNFISLEEIEDQFLRLREVFGCEYNMGYKYGNDKKEFNRNIFYVAIHMDYNHEKDLRSILPKILNEVELAKIRVCRIYDVCVVKHIISLVKKVFLPGSIQL